MTDLMRRVIGESEEMGLEKPEEKAEIRIARTITQSCSALRTRCGASPELEQIEAAAEELSSIHGLGTKSEANPEAYKL